MEHSILRLKMLRETTRTPRGYHRHARLRAIPRQLRRWRARNLSGPLQPFLRTGRLYEPRLVGHPKPTRNKNAADKLEGIASDLGMYVRWSIDGLEALSSYGAAAGVRLRSGD